MRPDSSNVATPGPVTLTADAVITPDVRLAPGWVIVHGRSIVDFGGGTAPGTASTQHVGQLITPGLVDMHVHGAGGGDMTTGRPEDLDTATRTLLGAGVTTAVVSLVTAPIEQLEQAMETIADWAAVDRPDRAALTGVHLEGPFLSAAHRGAHPEALLRTPDVHEMRRLMDVTERLRMVTLAPELPGGPALVTMLREAGVTVGAGHTAADHEQTLAAVASGLGVATHLFNGMPPPHHRRPAPAMTLLADDRVVVEIINDGVHVHPAMARAAVRAAGDGRFALVSDGVAATAAPEGNYRLGPIDIRSYEGRVETADGSSLGGGNATLDACVRRAVFVLGVDVATAVRAATTTPARALGLAPTVGRLVSGGPADLVVWDDTMRVEAVMRAGAWIRRDDSSRDGEPPSRDAPAMTPRGAS